MFPATPLLFSGGPLGVLISIESERHGTHKPRQRRQKVHNMAKRDATNLPLSKAEHHERCLQYTCLVVGCGFVRRTSSSAKSFHPMTPLANTNVAAGKFSRANAHPRSSPFALYGGNTKRRKADPHRRFVFRAQTQIADQWINQTLRGGLEKEELFLSITFPIFHFTY